MMQGKAPVSKQPPAEYDPTGLQLLIQVLPDDVDARKDGLDPITPELERQISDELDRRRKARHAAGDQQSSNLDDPEGDPQQLADIEDAPAPDTPVFARLLAEADSEMRATPPRPLAGGR